MKIIDIQNQIIEEFEVMNDWMEKYEYMIGLGKSFLQWITILKMILI